MFSDRVSPYDTEFRGRACGNNLELHTWKSSYLNFETKLVYKLVNINYIIII